MNSYSITEILLKSINCFYISIDKALCIKASGNYCPNVLPLHNFEPGSEFLQYFNQKYYSKFTAAFDRLIDLEESSYSLKIPVELGEKFFQIKWNIFPVADICNNVTGFEIVGIILKESAINVRSEEGNYSLFDDYSSPFFSLDLQGNFTKYNSSFTSLLHYNQDELLNKTFLSIADTITIADIKITLANALKGIPQNCTCSLVDKSGEKVDTGIIFTPLIEDGIFVGVNAYVQKVISNSQVQLNFNKDEKRLKLILTKLKKILNSSLDMICAMDESGKFTYVSGACNEILQYKPKELIGKRFVDFLHEEDVERLKKASLQIKKGAGTTNFENQFFKKDGSVANLIWSSRWDEGDKRFYNIARDATEKILSEATLKASEEKYKLIFYNHSLPSWIYDIETFKFLEINEAAIKLYGFSREEFLKMSLDDILPGKEVERLNNNKVIFNFDKQIHKDLWVHKKKNEDLFYAEVTSNSIEYQGRRARLVFSIDRTEQTLAEQELRKSNERFIFLSQATFDAIWDWDLATNHLMWGEGVYKMFEIADVLEIQKIEWWYSSIHPEDKERVEKKIKYHLENNVPNWEDEYRMKAGKTYKYIYDRGYIIYDDNKQPVRMIGAMQDLTERKAHENMLQNLNNSLEKRAKELAESNAELERFAYVSSHDLQEPLRMVTSFLQLLEKRYKDKLDNKANEYIHYAVDGAERMKHLILDLLEYSRVNSSKLIVEDVDVNEVVDELMLTYKNFLEETKGIIHSEKLPVIRGNKTQILQLFQNLIGNACKYKSQAPPVIDITFEEENWFYKFKIKDNGIGIDPRFFNKIFIIFQRLHNREEYSGTGIGLAICKKIIDKHGGKIGVTSAPGLGSTFYFTLPRK